MEGLHYKRIAEREDLAELALELRYTLNAKKVNASKLSKNKDKSKVKQAFAQGLAPEDKSSVGLAQKLQQLNEHFQNR